MKRIKWSVLQWYALAGSTGRAALFVAVFAFAFALLVAVPARREADAASVRAAGAASKAGPGRHDADSNASARAAEFYKMFPQRESAPKWLARIYSAAGEQELDLVEGSYKVSAIGQGKLLEYQVHLPVAGDYAQIRRFVLQVLREVPAASLDQLVFERESASSTDVAAEVRFTIFMRKE